MQEELPERNKKWKIGKENKKKAKRTKGTNTTEKELGNRDRYEKKSEKDKKN